MPGFDGTGPRGLGPMTGGRRGFCNPYSPLYGMGYPYSRPYPVMPSYGAIPYGAYGATPYAGMTTPYAGAATPYGSSPPAQTGLNPQLSKDQQLQMLKDQAQMLSQQLEQINGSIRDLEKK